MNITFVTKGKPNIKQEGFINCPDLSITLLTEFNFYNILLGILTT